MKKLMLSLSLLLLPAGAQAQEAEDSYKHKYGAVMVDGVWRAPSIEMALRLLMADDPDQYYYAKSAAVAILKQVFEPQTAAELDAFAEELGRIFRDGTEEQSRKAWFTLVNASCGLDGTLYGGSAAVFERVYESFEDRSHPRAQKARHGAASARVSFQHNTEGGIPAGVCIVIIP